MSTNNLARFENDGIELYINNETGEVFTGIKAAARMCNKNVSVIYKFVGVSFGDIKKVEVLTTGGLQGVSFLTEDQLLEVITKYNPTLLAKFAKLGTRMFLHQLAGFKKSQEKAAIDSDLLAAIASKLNGIDAVLIVNQEYLGVRKYSDSVYPGLNNFIDHVIATKMTLPQVKINFTASQWLDKNAPQLTKRQRICFYQQIASAHKLLVDEMPEKIKGTYWYTNKHEILFQRVKSIVERMTPERSVIRKQLSPGKVYEQLISLSEDEQSLVGTQMKTETLGACLGKKLNAYQATRLERQIKVWANDGVLSDLKITGKHFEVTPELVKQVKSFLGELA